MSNREKFEKHGWIIFKDFFDEEQSAQIRDATERSIKEDLRGDLLCNPYLKGLTVLNPRIVTLVKELLQGDPIYIGDSTISFNDTVMSLHKDNPDKSNPSAPDWGSTYTILRMGIYLQDYTKYSGGLILRDKSHKTISRWSGKIVNVKSSPRDLIIWNLRTTHSGNAKVLRSFPNVDLNPYLCKLIPKSQFLDTPQKREALFISYGLDDQHMKRYIAYLKTRKYSVNRWRSMKMESSDVEHAKKMGLQIWDMSGQASQIDDSTVYEKHVEMKF
ncbi:MAG: hypothetical protein JNJ65_01880 [Cyclobacteriaceae bacterium]|nr:hypothetical protein [Cyclobacteriaceae bacterium]